MEIRPDDIGYTTMMFKITSVKKAETFNICVGKVYEHEDKDRYNVYLVTGGSVNSKIGYYEVNKGEEVMDSDGDFDVKKFGEPVWDTTKEVSKPDVPKPVPKGDSKPAIEYVIHDITSNGDCFYASVDSATRQKFTYDKESVMELREKIAEQIESSRSMKDVIVQAYNHAGDSDDEDSDYTYMLKNYFDTKKINDISDIEEKNKMILDEFLKSLKTQGKWAINLTIGFYMELFNVCCIIVDERGLPDKVKDFNIEKVFGFGLDITKDTKYIFLCYTGRHYKLIHLNDNPPIFTWDTLPSVIQSKFINGPRNNKWTKVYGKESSSEPAAEPVAEPASEPTSEPSVEPSAKAEPVAEPAAKPVTEPVADDDDDMPPPPPPTETESEFSKQELKEIADLVKQKTLAELKALVLEKDPNAVLPANKQKLAECVVNPKKCSRKKGKKEKEKGGTRKLKN
jgi:hypothetical protein